MGQNSAGGHKEQQRRERQHNATLSTSSVAREKAANELQPCGRRVSLHFSVSFLESKRFHFQPPRLPGVSDF